MDNNNDAPTPPPRRWHAGERALVVLAVLGMIGAAKLTESFIVPVILGVLLSYALEPLVSLLERVHIHRALGAAAVLVLAIVVVAGSGFLLRTDAGALIAELPDAARKLRQSTREHKGPQGPIDHVREAAAELNKAAAEATGAAPPPSVPPPPTIAADLQHWVSDQSTKLLAVISQLAIAALLAYFLLAAGDTFRRKVVHLAGPTLAKRRVTVEILNDIHVQVQRYLLILLVTNALIGLGTWGILLAFGVERAGLWGAMAAILHVVPYAGTAVTTAGVAIAAFLQTGAISQAAIVGGTVFAMSSAIGMGLVPWLQGRAASMNAAAVFISLLFFGWLWGGWGLLLGAPLVAVLKTVADRVPRMEPLGELLGGAPVSRDEAPPAVAAAKDQAAIAKAADAAADAEESAEATEAAEAIGVTAAPEVADGAAEPATPPRRTVARRRHARKTTRAEG
jgi:predicted PurR-regulated permease PerM